MRLASAGSVVRRYTGGLGPRRVRRFGARDARKSRCRQGFGSFVTTCGKGASALFQRGLGSLLQWPRAPPLSSGGWTGSPGSGSCANFG